MSFEQFFVDEVEVELSGDMGQVVGYLDAEVPNFSCDGHGYRVRPLKGILGSQWRLQVELLDRGGRPEAPVSLAFIELDTLDGEGRSVRFLMRPQQGQPAT